jgi:hypothetical protein
MRGASARHQKRILPPHIQTISPGIAGRLSLNWHLSPEFHISLVPSYGFNHFLYRNTGTAARLHTVGLLLRSNLDL